MGCNTSKESVQAGAEEAKEDVKNGDISKSAASQDNKAEEAEEEVGTTGGTQQPEAVDESDESSDKAKEEAATRIQAVFRGHQARKSMKDTETSSQGKNTEDSEPTIEQLQEEFRADDVDLCNAATKIQASFRGHMSRKEQAVSSAVKAAGDMMERAVEKIEEKVDDAVNELEGIDLTDPDLHKAATKIQASFRGHKVRQEVPEAPVKK
ncbi:neuromodulin [Fopius arisanus]|uniref:Neuromodulin n=1 Tax=Fopius arisanus TaxID=64838 RepID=A0A0C9S2P5_9HYME|nr:PREDICTED: neuromodulin [Fopius arisanus]XP_011300683.1 PREDICTED: neuromodulin [Fopius arisanus]